MALYPLDSGRSMMKSDWVHNHGPSGTGSGCKRPAGLRFQCLLWAHTLQPCTYQHTKSMMSVHQYFWLTSSNVPSIPKCPAIFPSWCAASTSCHISIFRGTQMRPVFSDTNTKLLFSTLVANPMDLCVVLGWQCVWWVYCQKGYDSIH